MSLSSYSSCHQPPLVQQRLFDQRRLKKFDLARVTLTNVYRCTIERILSGCNCAALYCTAIAGLSRGWCGQPNASSRAHCLPSRTSTAPNVTGRPRISSRSSATRDTAWSPCYRREDGEGTTISKLRQKE
jgi:hypothetical protein